MDWKRVIDQACKAKRVTSIYKLARELKLDEAALAHYAHGRRIPDADACWKLAEATDTNPLLYIAAAEEERTRDDAKRKAWHERRLKSRWIAAASLAIAAVSTDTLLPNAHAQTSNQANATTAVGLQLCIMLNALRAFRRLKRLLGRVVTVAEGLSPTPKPQAI